MNSTILAVTVLVASTACVPSLLAADVSSSAGQTQAGALEAPDTTFVAEAIRGGLAEVELGKMAAQKASNSQVKQFAQKMVEDHSAANEKLTAIAKQQSLKPEGTKGTAPLEPDKNAQTKGAQLSQMAGPDFDRAYMRQMVEDHEKTVRLFKQETETGKSEQVKALAREMLPTIEEHLKMARSVSEQVQAAR